MQSYGVLHERIFSVGDTMPGTQGLPFRVPGMKIGWNTGAKFHPMHHSLEL
jgi:hypothetical protein